MDPARRRPRGREAAPHAATVRFERVTDFDPVDYRPALRGGDPGWTTPLPERPGRRGPRHRAPRAAIDGALRSAISQAIVRIHAEHYGKGATQAKTYVWDNLVVTVLRDVLTVAERTLVEVDRADTVREVRTVSSPPWSRRSAPRSSA